jgi:hypothetical protein
VEEGAEARGRVALHRRQHVAVDANAVNAGEGCASQVAGVLTIRHSQQPNLTIDFSWTLPVDRIIQPHEQFEYRIGVITDAQAFQFPEGTASTRFSAVSIPCP